MKKTLLLSSAIISGLTLFGQDKEPSEIEQIKENKVETIKIINGDTVMHEVRIISGDLSLGDTRMKEIRRHELKNEALSEDMEEMIKQVEFYINVDDEHKKMIVRKMKMNDVDVEEMLKAIEDDEDIVIDMKNGRGEMKVIKITIDEENGEEIKVIEKDRLGKTDKKRGPHQERMTPHDAQRQPGISVFPNPAKDELNLEFSVSEGERTVVSITDMNGKKLFSQQYAEPGLYTEKVSLDTGYKGLCIVKLESDHRSIIKKIIID